MRPMPLAVLGAGVELVDLLADELDEQAATTRAKAEQAAPKDSLRRVRIPGRYAANSRL